MTSGSFIGKDAYELLQRQQTDFTFCFCKYLPDTIDMRDSADVLAFENTRVQTQVWTFCLGFLFNVFHESNIPKQNHQASKMGSCFKNG